MNSVYSEPFIPEQLEPYYDQQASDAHEKMARSSLDKLMAEMPAIQTMEVGGQRLLYAELPAITDGENEAIALPLPYANGWKPHMYLRARYLQESAAPDKRLIILPSSSLKRHAYDLTPEELADVETGDLWPIAERQARLIKALGIGRLAITGYSFGAMEAAVLAEVLVDDVSLITIGVFEPTNIMNRSSKKLQKDFMAGGLAKFKQAVKDAHIPAVEDALNGRRMAWDIVRFGLNSALIKENSAIKKGMAANNLAESLLTVADQQPQAHILLAAAENSRIAPPEQLYYHYDRLNDDDANADMLVVGHYGHEMGDNIVAHGLLGKAALDQADK